MAEGIGEKGAVSTEETESVERRAFGGLSDCVVRVVCKLDG